MVLRGPLLVVIIEIEESVPEFMVWLELFGDSIKLIPQRDIISEERLSLVERTHFIGSSCDEITEECYFSVLLLNIRGIGERTVLFDRCELPLNLHDRVLERLLLRFEVVPESHLTQLVCAIALHQRFVD